EMMHVVQARCPSCASSYHPFADRVGGKMTRAPENLRGSVRLHGGNDASRILSSERSRSNDRRETSRFVGGRGGAGASMVAEVQRSLPAGSDVAKELAVAWRPPLAGLAFPSATPLFSRSL